MWPENSVVFINSAWPAKTVSAGLLCLYGLQTERQTWRSPVPLLIRCLIFPPDVGNEIVCNKVWRVKHCKRHSSPISPLCFFPCVFLFGKKRGLAEQAGWEFPNSQGSAGLHIWMKILCQPATAFVSLHSEKETKHPWLPHSFTLQQHTSASFTTLQIMFW